MPDTADPLKSDAETLVRSWEPDWCAALLRAFIAQAGGIETEAFYCRECGGVVRADEFGCCWHCGVDCTTGPAILLPMEGSE